MFEDSFEILESFITKFDDHPRVPDALYKLALALLSLEKKNEALLYFQDVISNYPNSGASLLAEQDLIKLSPQ